MKVAFIKQRPDIFGPWESIPFGDLSKLMSVWPGKASYFEFTLLMEADWYVVDQLTYTEYTHNIIHTCPGFEETSKKYSKTVPLDKIPFEEYDLVVSFDPLPGLPRPGKTVYAYYVHEHWDSSYIQSLTAPLYNYDLFLAHNDVRTGPLISLPASLPMPYPRDPDKVRRIFNGSRRNKVYLDWRVITALISTEQHIWTEEAHRLFEGVQKTLGLDCEIDWEFGTSFFGYADPPRWGDVGRYLKKLGDSKYYISIGRQSGAGQGLCDAASSGCICIGHDRVYHKIVCHPTCLCSNLTEAKKILDRLQNSVEYQKEVLAYQDKKLFEYFVNHPLNIFRDAVVCRSHL